MVEFVIASLAIIIIVSGLLQFIEIAAAKGKIDSHIRADAGKNALGGVSLIDSPDYIVDWHEGKDEMRHTPDDSKTTGSMSSTLGFGVVDHSAVDENGWTCLDGATNSAIVQLRSAVSASALGFIHVKESDKIELQPAMREWIIGKDTVTVGSDVWMPKLTIGGFDE